MKAPGTIEEDFQQGPERRRNAQYVSAAMSFKPKHRNALLYVRISNTGDTYPAPSLIEEDLELKLSTLPQ